MPSVVLLATDLSSLSGMLSNATFSIWCGMWTQVSPDLHRLRKPEEQEFGSGSSINWMNGLGCFTVLGPGFLSFESQ